MVQRMSERLASQGQRAFVGRHRELDALRAVLEAHGPCVIHVHGLAGIGKTTLLERFACEARASGAVMIRLDCRHVEPTAAGLLQALGGAIGGVGEDVETLTARLEALAPLVILALDTYEVFRLLDTWLRREFVPLLPGNLRLLLFGRESPSAGWQAMPGWGQLLNAVPMTPLDEAQAGELLAGLGVGGKQARLISRSTHGHPLALKLAATAVREEGAGHWLREAPLEHALDELTRLFLADVDDAVTRRILEGASITRRVTVSLLGALFPTLAPQDAFDRLRRLPFVDLASDGLIIHDVVRDAIDRSLHASDPCGHLAYRRAAWRQLVGEAGSAASDDLWRYTADMLYLIENPVVREAFFPSGTPPLTVEQARPGDGETITAIIQAHEGEDAARRLLQWWRRLPHGFSVVRDRQGRITGFYVTLRSDRVEPAWLIDDPVTADWQAHLEQEPLACTEMALFCRRWLSLDEGDSPSEVQAAVWLDLKRTYLELRPMLRRVYLTALDLAAYAPVAGRLGFDMLAEAVTLDDRHYPSAVLDFGPGSVDGWLAGLAAAELGMQRPSRLLDLEARELVLEEGRVSLTPLEFGVMRHLLERRDKAVSRSELLRDVWGTRYEGGSNVVDAVVRGLRRKLGKQTTSIETVTGVGYRLRSGPPP